MNFLKTTLFQKRLVVATALTALLLTACQWGGGNVTPSEEPPAPSSSQVEEMPSSEASSSSSEEASGSSAPSSGAAGSSSSSKAVARPPAATPPASSTPSSSASQQTLPPPTPTPAGSYVVGYYPSWARAGGYTPLSLDGERLTHINYAFADVNAQNRLVMANPTTDQKNFADLRSLKKQNGQIKTLISVGGWDYSKNLSNVAATAGARETFAQSCVDFILEHGFDGIDLDWEFPVSGGISGNSNRPEDKQNLTKLLAVLRQKLDAQAKEDGRPYLLTIAGAANSTYLKKIELASVASLVDYIFIMGYDFHGPWDGYADLNAPLYEPDDDSPQYGGNISDGVGLYLAGGAPASKLVLGMPFYGYQYTVTGGGEDGLYGSFSSGKSISFDKVKASFLGNSSFQQLYHSAARVPYLFDGSTFITYEDEDSIAEKAQLAKEKGLGGIGAWELSHDRSGALLRSACRAFGK